MEIVNNISKLPRVPIELKAENHLGVQFIDGMTVKDGYYCLPIHNGIPKWTPLAVRYDDSSKAFDACKIHNQFNLGLSVEETARLTAYHCFKND